MNETIVCSKCLKGYMIEKTNKSNQQKFLACNNYPECKNTQSLENNSTVTVTQDVLSKDRMIVRQNALGHADAVLAVKQETTKAEYWEHAKACEDWVFR